MTDPQITITGVAADTLVKQATQALVAALEYTFREEVRQQVNGVIAGAYRTKLRDEATQIIDQGVLVKRAGDLAPTTIPFDQYVRELLAGLLPGRSSQFRDRTRIEAAIVDWLQPRIGELVKQYLDENIDRIREMVGEAVVAEMSRKLSRAY